jgi:branched-subunit amino acid transport protein
VSQWLAVLGASAGCYVIKLAGLSLPPRVLENKRVERVAALLPVTVLATLIVIQTFTTGHHVVIDARAAGVAAAIGAQLLRAPFLVVIIVAAAVTALLRV